MINAVKNYLIKYNIQSQNILIALSGGCDSVVLLDILSKLKEEYSLNITAIHLNHNWRGVEAKRDEDFSQLCAKNRGVEFYSEILNNSVKKTEVDAREARYDFFEKCAKKFSSDTVFLAHNKNDNSETVLYRIAKGTGLKGLCAIPEKRGIFCRPLLGVSRSEIENYARENNLEFIFDSSNDDIKYKRNLIRKKILPILREINPDVENALDNLSKISQMQYEILENVVNSVKEKVFLGDEIILDEFLKLNEALKCEIINEFLKGDLKNRDLKRVSSYVDFINRGGTRKSINSKLFLVIENNRIKKTPCAKEEKNMQEVPVKGLGEYDFCGRKILIDKVSDVKDFSPKDGSKFLNLDFSLPLVLRTRREGDIFCPYGMNGSMKLKEYLINKKIQRHKRDNLLLLAHKSEILCILGIEISKNAAVKDAECIRIRISE